MTLVVTERLGVLAIYTRLPSGELKQRALIDVDSTEASHLELAELGVGMSERFGWNGVEVSKTQPGKRAPKLAKPKREELPTPPPERQRRRYESTVPAGYRSLPRGRLANELRPALVEEIVAYVRAHPGATSTAISAGTKIHDRTIDGLMRRPEVGALVRYEQATAIDPRRYFVRDSLDERDSLDVES